MHYTALYYIILYYVMSYYSTLIGNDGDQGDNDGVQDNDDDHGDLISRLGLSPEDILPLRLHACAFA